MFNLEDLSYTHQPKIMTIDIITIFFYELHKYLKFTNQKKFNLILHGGEPSLWPIENYTRLFELAKDLNNKGFDIEISIQTNLYKINWQLIELFSINKVTLGISIDGPKSINDEVRVTFNNKGSYQVVIHNLQKLIDKGYKHIIGGILSVASLNLTAEEYLDWVETLPIKVFDVLWPQEFNYHNTPWGANGFNEYKQYPKYGIWFYDLFEEWVKRDNPQIKIRLFYQTIACLNGSTEHTDFLINDSIRSFCLNTDGSLDYHDYFRAYADGAAYSGFNIGAHELYELHSNYIFNYLFNLKNHLPKECLLCKHKNICGGGFLPGRFKKNDELPRYKSILCYDEYYFFDRISDYLDSIKFAETLNNFRQ